MKLHTIAPFRAAAWAMVLCLAGGLLSAAETASAENVGGKPAESSSSVDVNAEKIADRRAVYAAHRNEFLIIVVQDLVKRR